MQAVAIGAIGSLPGLLRTGPGKVRLLLKLAIEKSDRRGPWQWPGAERVLGLRPIGLGGICIIPPREIEIGTLFAAARRVFPFSLRGKTVSAFLKITVPRFQIITEWQFLLGTEPIAVISSSLPPDADHRMIPLTIQHLETIPIPTDPAVG